MNELAHDLMARFAERTGLTSSQPQRRYLWTDAFAVCNYLALDRIDLALALADQVHHVLGRHRDDDLRRGWISGLSDAEGEAHPTMGGLRIGKPLPERAPNEPFSDELEWERDGQYFHYLTKWIHALGRLGAASGDARYAAWARELAEVARARFVIGTRMAWKMSIDLTRPVVPTMGHHDPLDGYVTALELGLPADDYSEMIDARALATSDPLGIGGLLTDAHRLGDRDPALRRAMIEAARAGLAFNALDTAAPAAHRLAFRELGLVIGLQAEPIDDGLRDELLAFWADPASRRSRTWREHEDISDVMLATALVPDGFLGLEGPKTENPASAGLSIRGATQI